MKKITIKHIKESYKKITEGINLFNLFDEEVERKNSDLFEILSFDDETKFMKDEQSLLRMTVATAFFIIKESGCKINIVNMDIFDIIYDKNFNLFGTIDESKGNLGDIYATYNSQPLLIDFLFSMIFSNAESDNVKIRAEAVTGILLFVKTIVDCFLIEDDTLQELFESEGEYSEEEFYEMQDDIKEYLSGFKKSSFFMKLSHSEKEECEFVIIAFSDFMYNHFLQTPEDWSFNEIMECAIDIVPRKVMGDNNFFRSIEPVLVAFLKYSHSKGINLNGKIFAERIRGIGDEILKNEESPESWGTGKSLFKSGGIDELHVSENSVSSKSKEKLGRNDPCYCGSGKKYKKCCMIKEEDSFEDYQNYINHYDDENKEPLTYNEFRGQSNKATESLHDIENAMKDKDFSSVEEMNEFISEYTKNKNSAPMEQFLGLSPEQMQLILRGNFDDNKMVTLNKDISKDVLSEVPVLKQCKFILGRISENEKGAKATQKGKFPRKLVQEFHELFIKDIDLFDKKPMKEDDVLEIEKMKFFLLDEKIIKKQKGYFLLTKKGKIYLSDKNDFELYKIILKYFNESFNWLYRTGYVDDFEFLQTSYIFSLYILKVKAEKYIHIVKVIDFYKTAFPDFVKDIDFKTGYGFSIFNSVYSYLFFYRIAFYLGFIEFKDGATLYHRDEEKGEIKTTEFFDKIFKWEAIKDLQYNA